MLASTATDEREMFNSNKLTDSQPFWPETLTLTQSLALFLVDTVTLSPRFTLPMMSYSVPGPARRLPASTLTTASGKGVGV